MPAKSRHILHVDMDAFYASVEQRDNPELRNKPLVVGGGSNRGVVAAASYEARRFGIHSAMPFREALRRCPELEHVKPRMSHYKAVSEQVFAVFREFTPVIEGLSLDEAFLDVSGSIALFGPAEDIAAAIKNRIKAATELTASVGVAPNKLVAKIASDLRKPDGLVVVQENNVTTVLDPLPVEVIPGIGRKTLERLHRAGIYRILDLRTAEQATLEKLFGKFADRSRARATGIDDRPVHGSRGAKSVSAEETFGQDLEEFANMQREILRLAERTSSQLRRKGLSAGTVHVKIREADFTTYTRQQTLHPPASDTTTLYDAALGLLRIWLSEHPGAPIRLLGVGSSDFASSQQGDLFAGNAEEDRGALDKTADEIRKRFGSVRLGRARTFKSDQIG